VPKFLIHASYTVSGTAGLLKKGVMDRRKAVEELMASVGGKLEAYYFTFGDADAILIIDVPDHQTMLSIGFAVRATGMLHSKTTLLIPLEEADRAAKQEVHFRPPGQ
jgi:uncharacterized protein with GYD domain